jgi:hypothetical protein
LGKLPIVFNFFHPDGIFGLKPLLSYFLKLMALYFFDASVASAVFLTKPGLGAYLFILGVSLPGIIGFFLVFYSVHKSLALSKENLLSKINIAYSSITCSLTPMPSGSKMEVALLLFREIKEKSDWPINIGTSMKGIGLFLSPTISFLMKIALMQIFGGSPLW